MSLMGYIIISLYIGFMIGLFTASAFRKEFEDE